jgi:hypothetical protein
MSYNINSGYGQIIAALPRTTGKHFLVCGASNANFNAIDEWFQMDPDGVPRRYSTIDAAINACVANRNDVIIVAPNHVETLTTAGAIALDVAGVKIIGLGEGNNRPVITMGTSTSATITQSADNTVIDNIVVVAAIDGLLNAIVVTGNNCTTNIEFQDTSAAVEAATAIRFDTADNFTAKVKYIGFIAGNATVRAIAIDDCDTGRLDIDFYGIVTTAVVNFVDSLSTNIHVTGRMYTSGTTDFSKTVVDTIGSSIWTASFFDATANVSVSGGNVAAIASDDISGVSSSISSVAAQLNVPTADVTTNVNARDVTGNKTDAAVTAVGTTKSLAAYAKGLVTMNTVQSADSTNNAFAGDVVGNKTDASVYVPGTTKSLAAYAKGNADLQERVVKKVAATIVNGQTLFTIAGGPIQILGLVSICETGNDATASTLQYNATPTSGSAQTISAASASLANATAGASVALAGTALSTAALYNANGPNLIANPGTVMAPAGVITAVVGVGSTTGTWAHYLRYRPLAVGVTVS